MVIAQRIADKALLVELQRRCFCVGECGKILQPNEKAWSYQENPCDGNYVICTECRYGTEYVT